MRVKVVPLGSKAVTAYYAALIVLAGLFLAFLGGMVWSISRLPPCTSISKDFCGVNDWSIAGLAATILAVAATVLAFLGAFAVAVFWRDLDTKVKTQVDELTEKRVQLISFNLQTLLQADVDRRLKILENRFEQRFLEIDEENKRLWKERHDLKMYVDGQDHILLGGVVSQYPWLLEAWAKEWTDKAPIIPIAYGMAARYTRVVDAFLDDPVRQQEHLKEIAAPSSNPEDYLQAAERWANQIQGQQEKSNALDAITKRRQSIVAWRGPQQP
jgi:hypothetical protein